MLGRVARLQGKLLYTSTPYAMNWLYTEVEQPFKSGERKDIFMVQFDSSQNPSFPKEEFERQRRILDPKTFRRKYMGIHERMEGLVYEIDLEENFIEPFIMEKSTRCFAGVDFGFVEGHEFAITVRAITEDGMRMSVAVLKMAGLDPIAQIEQAQRLKNHYKIEHFYCDPARPDMIEAFNRAGLRASGFYGERKQYRLIIPGINKHIELIRSGYYKIFRGRCQFLEDEYSTYHWPENSDGEIVKEVPVPKNDHLMDAERYVTIGTMHIQIKEQPQLSISRKYPAMDHFDPTKETKKTGSFEDY